MKTKLKWIGLFIVFTLSFILMRYLMFYITGTLQFKPVYWRDVIEIYTGTPVIVSIIISWVYCKIVEL